MLENLIYTVLKYSNKIFIQNSYFLLKHSYKLRIFSYKLFNKLFFLKRFLYTIDAINVSCLSLKYKLNDILLFFIINELHKTKKHYYFLNNLRLILKIIYNKSRLISGFKLIITGPIGKHSRTKIFKFQFGYLQLQTIHKIILYSISTCTTKFGSLGIRL
jgi:hypothetical protein